MIEFYILEDLTSNQAWIYTCQLIEKEYKTKNSIHVQVNSEHEAHQLDQLLWIFKDNSFIPHELTNDKATTIPVIINYTDLMKPIANIIINLSESLFANDQINTKLIEIIFANQVAQAHARVRYKHYREQGYNIQTHKIKANQLCL